MKQLIPPTKRQQYILRTLEECGRLNNRELLERTQAHFDKTSRVTLIRDLNSLLKKKLIRRRGKGRGIFYESARLSRISRVFHSEEYFQQDPDERTIEKARIDFSRHSLWNDFFTKEELEKIDALTRQFQKRLAAYPPALAKKELERITIEFSWRSSHIEGDTYSLLETERLVKEQREAKGKTHEEALMILNHKSALEYVWKYPRHFQKISLRKIEEIHALIVKDLNIAKGMRKRPAGIIGTKYMPHDNVYQIRESMEALCHLVNATKHPFLKAALAIAGLSYIQPFEDGNKRTSRLLGNALLLAFHYCPLSYRSIDEIEYKKAMIFFYEQHTLFLFKKLIIEQYEFAVEHYFL
jgi:Fic family protein